MQPVFDVDSIPFSRRGAWLNLSRVVAPHEVHEHVHLVSHKGGMHAVLMLIPESTGPMELSATPSVLTWRGERGMIEAVFDGRFLRIRGRGAALRIEDGQPNEPFRGSFHYRDPVDTAPIFSSNETGQRYRVGEISGDLSVAPAADGRAAVRVAGDEWEIEIEEFRAVPTRTRRRPSFIDAVAGVEAEFTEYARAISGAAPRNPDASALAAYVLWSATVEPAGFVSRESVLMSMNWMDRIWIWDHCFNAVALAPAFPQLALDQFLVVFDHQDDTGALPDLIGHSVVSFGYVKPPIHGWAFSWLEQLIPNLGVESQQVALDRLAKLTAFWLEGRVVPGHRLPHYQHGNDAGWDNSTMFDASSVIEAPDLAALLVGQLEVMADLGERLGDSRTAHWRRQSAQLLEALEEELWDGATFVARSCADGTARSTTSLLRLLPLIAAHRLRPEIVSSLVNQLRDHLTEWGLATELPTSDRYESDGYWRGPIWAPPTLLFVDGLRRAGEHDLATDIRERFLRLCEKNGFAENFDALTGAGLRDRAYTWTAACYLILAAEESSG